VKAILPLRRKANGPKPPGARLKLRLAWGDAPPVPSTLVLPSGRKYLVLGVNGKTLSCLVCSPNDTEDVLPLLAWTWATRKRKARA
jgi:hypothetical protein